MLNKSKSPKGAADTLIGAGTEAEGALKTPTGLRIEGEFRGELESEGNVVIGKTGIARCSILARDVTIAGKVFGDVWSSGKLTILPGGHLDGNAQTALLIVHEGGCFNGTVRMKPSEGAAARLQPAVSAPAGPQADPSAESSGKRDKKAV